MATSSKSPAMLLQEYAAKERIGIPLYNLRTAKASKEKDYQIKVNVADVTALGIGRSKQIAKQNAAYSALKKLIKKGNAAFFDKPPSPYTPKVQIVDYTDSEENYVGNLQSSCAINKINQPIFREICAIGPSHSRKFIVECEIDSLRTQADGRTKKLAKQMSSYLMLEKLKLIFPKIFTSDEEFAINNVNNTMPFVKDKRVKFSEFSGHFARIMKKKKLTAGDFVEILKGETEINLKRVMRKVGLQYEFVQLQWAPDPIVMVLDINMDTAFTMMATGETTEEAKMNALRMTFTALRDHINAADCYN